MRRICYFLYGLSAWGCSGTAPTSVASRQTEPVIASAPIDLGAEQFVAEDTAVISTLNLDQFADFSVVGLTYFIAPVPDNQRSSKGAELGLVGGGKQPSKAPSKPAAVNAERLSHIDRRHTVDGTELGSKPGLPGVFGDTRQIQAMVLAAVNRRGAQATSPLESQIDVRFSDAIGVTFSGADSGQIPIPTPTRFMRVIIALDGEDATPRVITAYPIAYSRTASADAELAPPSDLKVDEAFAKRVQAKLSMVTGRPVVRDPNQLEPGAFSQISHDVRQSRLAIFDDELRGRVQLEDMRHNIRRQLAEEGEAKEALRDARRAAATARLEEAAAAKRDAKRSQKTKEPAKAEPTPQSWWSSTFGRLFSW